MANKEDTIIKGKNMLVVAQKEFSAMKQRLAQVKLGEKLYVYFSRLRRVLL